MAYFQLVYLMKFMIISFPFPMLLNMRNGLMVLSMFASLHVQCDFMTNLCKPKSILNCHRTCY